MASQSEKARAFRALHDRTAPLRLLNAWDVGSAKVLVAAGAPALGTTSAGVSNALGLPDGESLTRDAMLAVVHAIASAVDVPVTADLEAGYSQDPEGVAETVRLAVAAGAVGVNLEDSHDGRLAPVDEQAARIRAAVEAAGGLAFVNARTDTYWYGSPDLDETVARLRAYAAAGADGVFVPAPRPIAPDVVAQLVAATDLPLNLLAGPEPPPPGVARISSGSGLVRTALSAAYTAAEELLAHGTVTPSRLSYADVNAMMRA